MEMMGKAANREPEMFLKDPSLSRDHRVHSTAENLGVAMSAGEGPSGQVFGGPTLGYGTRSTPRGMNAP